VKDLKIVFWPRLNSKKMIDDCVPHPRTEKAKKKWERYQLMSCGRTYKNYQEADDTERATDGVGSDLDDFSEESEHGEEAIEEESRHPAASKSKRKIKQKLDMANFTAGSELDLESERDSVPSKKNVKSNSVHLDKPILSIPKTIGDMSSSKEKLPIIMTKAALKSFTTSSTSSKKDDRLITSSNMSNLVDDYDSDEHSDEPKNTSTPKQKQKNSKRAKGEEKSSFHLKKRARMQEKKVHDDADDGLSSPAASDQDNSASQRSATIAPRDQRHSTMMTFLQSV